MVVGGKSFPGAGIVLSFSESYSPIGENPQDVNVPVSRRRKQVIEETDQFFDDVPDAEHEIPLKRVAALDGRPGQRIEITTADGARTQILAESSAVINVTTPMKTILRQPSFSTPEREGRLKSLTDDQKLGLASLYIDYATTIIPFKPQRGLVNPVKEDLRKIWRNQKIGDKYLKELVADPSTLSTYIMGKSGVQVLSGQNKGEGLLQIIHSVMREKFPGREENLWTPSMMREIKEQIMEKMRSFC